MIVQKLLASYADFGITELRVLFIIAPQFLAVETFRRRVQIPAEWELETSLCTPDPYSSSFEECWEMARAVTFSEQMFEFERPKIEGLLRALDDVPRMRHLVEATQLSPQEPPQDLAWLPPEVAVPIRRIVNSIREVRKDIIEIRLYGSWQRGDATPSSDVDLAVLVDRRSMWLGRLRVLDWVVPILDKWASRDLQRKIDAIIANGRLHSIIVVDVTALKKYIRKGPVYRSNWARAVQNGYVLYSEALLSPLDEASCS
jgi:predicted nucleotidyltransferase